MTLSTVAGTSIPAADDFVLRAVHRSALGGHERALRLTDLNNRVGHYVSVKDQGATGDGVTDDTAALQLAMASLATNAELVFPRGEYLTSTALTVPVSNRRIIFEPGAVIIPTGLINTLAVVGTAPTTFVALSSNATAGARSVAVADGTAFTRGQWVFLRSQAALPDCLNSNSRKRGEWLQVCDVVTNTVHFLTCLLYDYLTADTAEISTNTGCMVENVTIEGYNLDTGTLPSGTVRGIQAQYAAGLRILDFDLRNTRAVEGSDNGSSTGINLDNVADVWVQRGRMHNLGYYGLAVDGASRRVWASDIHFTRCRHSISTINNGAYGEPAHLNFTRLLSERSVLSAFDTHDVGRFIEFNTCSAISAGDHGFNCRSPLTNFINCQSERSTLDGFAVAVTCPDVTHIECRALNNTRHGLATKNTDAVIRGGRYDTNNTGLTYWAAGITLRGGIISDCEVVNNGRLGIGWATEGDVQGKLVIDNIRAPYDATNQTFFMGYEDAKSFGYGNCVVRNSELEGYGQYLFCILGNEAANGLPRHTGNRLIASAAGAEMRGIATLVSGTKAVTTTAVRNYGGTTGSTSRLPIRSQIKLTRVSAGTSNLGALYVSAISDGSGFTITSTNGSDTGDILWEVDH